MKAHPLSALPREALAPREARPEIIRRLTLAINNGVLPPGTTIRQQQIADHYSVSRMPVREALRQLEAKGLLVSGFYKGARVSDTANAKALIYGRLPERLPSGGRDYDPQDCYADGHNDCRDACAPVVTELLALADMAMRLIAQGTVSPEDQIAYRQSFAQLTQELAANDL